jgi:acyl-CoA thioesterase I
MKYLLIFSFPLLFACKKQRELVITANTKHKTVIIGSSIASGVGASQYSNSWAGLMATNNSEDTFINNSVPGYTTFQFLPTNYPNPPIRPDTTLNITSVLRLKPDVVVISITTNDIANGYTPSVYMRNMRVITDTLKAHSIKFLITSSTVRDDLSHVLNDSLLVVSHKLKDTYSNNFVEIMSLIADTTTLKPKTELYTSDKIHPNNAGHALLYSRINLAYQALIK